MVERSMIRFDPVSVEGQDGLGFLRELAGWGLATVAVLVVITGAVGIVLFLLGKVSAHSKMQVTAMVVSFNVCVGAAVLGSVGGIVYWGSGLGSFSLMPAGAQQPTVDVTKNPALSTCPSEKFLTGDSGKAAVRELLPGDRAGSYLEGSKLSFVSVKWYPKGPDCTSSNLIPDPCKKIQVIMHEVGDRVNVPSAEDAVNKAECSS